MLYSRQGHQRHYHELTDEFEVSFNICYQSHRLALMKSWLLPARQITNADASYCCCCFLELGLPQFCYRVNYFLLSFLHKVFAVITAEITGITAFKFVGQPLTNMDGGC